MSDLNRKALDAMARKVLRDLERPNADIDRIASDASDVLNAILYDFCGPTPEMDAFDEALALDELRTAEKRRAAQEMPN